MTLTYLELNNIAEGLKAVKDEKVSGSVALRIAKVLKELDDTLSVFQEARKTTLENYADKTDDGEIDAPDGLYKFENASDEELNQLNKEMYELLLEEVDFKSFIKSSDLDKLQVSIQTVLLLDPIVKE
jgi:hypothetical protein